MDHKTLFGVAAIVIVLISYAPYFRDILAGKSRPHAISWFIWGVLTVIGFAGQLAGDAGPGAWATGLTAVLCLLVCIAGIKSGRTSIVPLDWLSLAGAAIALVLWAVTRNPLLSVVLITVIYAIGFIPTFRKSWYSPWEETLATYVLAGLTCLVSLFALSRFTWLTALYPASLLLMNWAFTAMLLMRRRQLAPLRSAEPAYALE